MLSARGVKSLIICQKCEDRERKRFLSYQALLACLACYFQHLNACQITITVKVVAKVFSL